MKRGNWLVSDGRRKTNCLRLRKEKFELDNKGRGRNALSRENDVLRNLRKSLRYHRSRSVKFRSDTCLGRVRYVKVTKNSGVRLDCLSLFFTVFV